MEGKKGINKGVLVELNREQLKQLGAYKKGSCFILEDLSETILFLKPEKAKKHEYFIPSLQTSLLQHLSYAIYAFLHQEGKDRTMLLITDDKSGVHEFFVGEDIYSVYGKLSDIVKLNLL